MRKKLMRSKESTTLFYPGGSANWLGSAVFGLAESSRFFADKQYGEDGESGIWRQ
jgi:hypothetical protein